jgi:hypothetical protein
LAIADWRLPIDGLLIVDWDRRLVIGIVDGRLITADQELAPITNH